MKRIKKLLLPLCFLSSLFFVLFQGGKLSIMLFVIVLFISVYLLLNRWNGLARSTGTRHITKIYNGVVEAGRSIEVSLTIKVPMWFPIPYVLITERFERQQGKGQKFTQPVSLSWNRTLQLNYKSLPLQRGIYEYAPVQFVMKDIFGLTERTVALPIPTLFRVAPQTVLITQWEKLLNRMKGTQFQATRTLTTRESTQVDGVREYIYGDRLSRIHWNATARTGQWKSKEFEREVLPKLIVMLDRDQQAYGNELLFELAVSVVASIMKYTAIHHLPTGLYAPGKDGFSFVPTVSKANINEMQMKLIDVERVSCPSLAEGFQLQPGNQREPQLLIMVLAQFKERELQAIETFRSMKLDLCIIFTLEEQQLKQMTSIHNQLNKEGIDCYFVSTLNELPQVLGGGAK